MTLGAADKLARVNLALEEYELSIGLPKVVPHGEGMKYLNMNEKQMLTLSADECGVAAGALAQYAFHLQRELNKEKATASYANSEINKNALKEVSNYQGSTGEERKIKAIAGNEYTAKLEQLRAQAQARADRLEYLPNRVDAIRLSFIELQQSKRKING